MKLEMVDVQVEGVGVYRLKWQGSRVPRGAFVGDHEIRHTQWGVVYGEGEQEIGVYTRIIDGDGPKSDQHEMIVKL